MGSIDFFQSTDNAKGSQCNHFTIRGYVAIMRQKDSRITSPFNEFGEESSIQLPPLVAPKFRNWRCDNCVEQVKKAEAISNIDQRNFNNRIQQARTPKSSEDTVVSNKDLDTNLKNNLNHEVPNGPSLEVCLSPIVHKNERGSEGNVVSDMEVKTNNLNNMEDDQWPKQLITSNAIIIGEVEAVVEDDNVPEGYTNNNNVENDHVLVHHPRNSTLKSRKKRKMHLQEELFREKDEANTKQIIVLNQGPSNMPSSQAISTNMVVIVESEKVTKNSRGRKRKSPSKSKNAYVSMKRTKTKGNVAQGKRKVVIKENKELGNNDKMVEDSAMVKQTENVSYMPMSATKPSAPNREGMEERLNLPSNNHSLTTVCDRSPCRPSKWRLVRKDGGNYSSKQPANVTSGKGKGVLIEEIDKDSSDCESSEEFVPISMKNFIDLTHEDDDSNYSLNDDITMEVRNFPNHNSEDAQDMEVAEILVNSLPDVQNVNRVLKNSSVTENPQAKPDEKIGTTQESDENSVHIPRNETLINNHSYGKPSGPSNLYSTQSPYGFALLTSTSRSHISPIMDTNNHFDLSQTSRFNWGISSSYNFTLHDSDATFQIGTGTPKSLNNAFLRYDDAAKNIVSPSDALPKQNKKFIDLNKLPSSDINELEHSVKYPISPQHNGMEMEVPPNESAYFDLNSDVSTQNRNNSQSHHRIARKSLATSCSGSSNAKMLKEIQLGESRGKKLEIGKNKSNLLSKKSNGYFPCSLIFDTPSNLNGGNVGAISDRNMRLLGNETASCFASFTQNGNLFGWLDCENEIIVPLNSASGSLCCEINKNLAEFTVPEVGNSYMKEGEEDSESEQKSKTKGEKSAFKQRCGLTSKHGGSKKNKNLKRR